MSRSVRLGLMACAVTLLAACMSGAGRGDAPSSPKGASKGGVQCPSTRSANAGQEDRFEREWSRIDAEYEQALRNIFAAGSTSTTDALASLDKDVLKPHNWSLSRYLVRVVRQLHSNSVREAGVELGQETYAEASLREASWDGYNAWEIVQEVRGETLQLFVQLEKTRTTDNPNAREAQRVADGLINTARTAEPWVFTGCRRPPPEQNPLTAAPVSTTRTS